MKQHRGFSLVEVMISAVIILMSATGMMTFYKQMIDMQLKRFYIDIAVRLANEKAQDLHDFQAIQGKNGLQGQSSFSQIKNNQGGVLPAGKVQIQPYDGTSNTIEFERNWRVAEATDLAGKAVVVTISWQHGNQNKQHFSLTTILTPVAPHRRIHLVDNYSLP